MGKVEYMQDKLQILLNKIGMEEYSSYFNGGKLDKIKRNKTEKKKPLMNISMKCISGFSFVLVGDEHGISKTEETILFANGFLIGI